jgi:GTP pyrophosphokinase
MAEYGVAAHWKYKQGLDKKGNEEAFAWIRQLLEAQQDTEAEDFIKNIKVDLFADEVFVFTPKGDVVNMPAGATPIDLAYAIHSAVGNRMTGCKLNGRIAPIDSQLKNGDIVEILTSKEAHGPSRDWVKIVKTTEARNKIKQWFKKECREENIVNGKEDLDRELRANLLYNGFYENEEVQKNTLNKFSFNTVDELYAAIGYGGIQLWKLLPRVKEEYQKTHKPAPEPQQEIAQQTPPPNLNKKAAGGVLVEGMDNCLIKFSRCCNPLPGDEIVGFITRGFGVSIHKRSCSNVPKDFSQAPEPERWVRAHWAGEVKEEFKSTLHIVATDRSGLLADVTQQLFNMHIFIHSLNSREVKNSENAVISATITINGLSHLQTVIDRLQKIKGVISIDRS